MEVSRCARLVNLGEEQFGRVGDDGYTQTHTYIYIYININIVLVLTALLILERSESAGWEMMAATIPATTPAQGQSGVDSYIYIYK